MAEQGRGRKRKGVRKRKELGKTIDDPVLSCNRLFEGIGFFLKFLNAICKELPLLSALLLSIDFILHLVLSDVQLVSELQVGTAIFERLSDFL